MSTRPALVEGRVAVVTGAASGISLAAAKRFAAMGLKVCMADRSHEAARYLRNEPIGVLNRLLGSECKKHANCRVLDAEPVLTAAHGSILSADLCNSDGWHLSEEGSNLLTAAIRQSLQPP